MQSNYDVNKNFEKMQGTYPLTSHTQFNIEYNQVLQAINNQFDIDMQNKLRLDNTQITKY